MYKMIDKVTIYFPRPGGFQVDYRGIIVVKFLDGKEFMCYCTDTQNGVILDEAIKLAKESREVSDERL